MKPFLCVMLLAACNTPPPAAKSCIGDACCSDGQRDGDETDIDCGGSCDACADTKKCGVGADCVSKSCSAERCAAASCSDGLQNGKETDVDCGGGCTPCADDKACVQASDCASGSCGGARCVDPPQIAWSTNAPALDATCTLTAAAIVTVDSARGASLASETGAIALANSTTASATGISGQISDFALGAFSTSFAVTDSFKAQASVQRNLSLDISSVVTSTSAVLPTATAGADAMVGRQVFWDSAPHAAGRRMQRGDGSSRIDRCQL